MEIERAWVVEILKLLIRKSVKEEVVFASVDEEKEW